MIYYYTILQLICRSVPTACMCADSYHAYFRLRLLLSCVDFRQLSVWLINPCRSRSMTQMQSDASQVAHKFKGTASCCTWHMQVFYFVCEMKLCREFYFAKRYNFGCNFWDREGRTTIYTQIVLLSVSVLVVVANTVETLICTMRTASKATSRRWRPSRWTRPLTSSATSALWHTRSPLSKQQLTT